MTFQSFTHHTRPTLLLAVPIMAGQLSQMLMGLIDSAMVGRLGVTPLAASAFANNLVSVPFVFGVGMLLAVSVRVSQAHGAQSGRETGELLRHGLALGAALGLLLMALVWGLGTGLHRFGQAPEVAREAHTFLLLLGASLPATLVVFGFKNFCEALGKPWVPTWVLLGAVPLNAAINWFLIYGNMGAPALGLAGAGWGTLGARVISLVIIAIYVLRSPLFRAALPPKWNARFEIATWISLLRIGFPAALQVLVEVGAFALGAIMVGWIGKDALAAHHIALSCAATSFMLPLGLSSAASIRIGQALGGGQFDQVRAIGLNALALSLMIMSLCAALFVFAGASLARGFVDEPQVIALAAQLFVVAGAFQLFDGLQIVASGALRGLNDATVPMLMSFTAYWILGLPVGYALAFGLKMGATGIWLGFALGLGVVATLLVMRFWWKSRAASSLK